MMQIILLERVEKLGQMGDVVTVKGGYGRNFLLPQGKAIRASENNLKAFETRKIELEAQNLASKKEAEAVAEKMDGVEINLIRQASESGQLYGSVNARDIADALCQAGFKVSRNQIIMDRSIKSIGIFDYKVRLHPELSVLVAVNVAQSDEEAKAQSQRKARGEDVVITAATRDAQIQAEQQKAQAEAFAKAAKEREELVESQDTDSVA